jgi:hypothetical protein
LSHGGRVACGFLDHNTYLSSVEIVACVALSSKVPFENPVIEPAWPDLALRTSTASAPGPVHTYAIRLSRVIASLRTAKSLWKNVAGSMISRTSVGVNIDVFKMTKFVPSDSGKCNFAAGVDKPQGVVGNC